MPKHDANSRTDLARLGMRRRGRRRRSDVDEERVDSTSQPAIVDDEGLGAARQAFIAMAGRSSDQGRSQECR